MAGIYIHIPFCRQACHYCNFHFSTSLHYRDDLVNALIQETDLQKHYTGQEKTETVYFGGGTPSLLAPAEINRLMKVLHSAFSISTDAEITLEANPDDITTENMLAWKDSGINRLSIGIQSFFDEDLVWMNRAHNSRQALQGLEMAQQQFDNITIDLIYGTPGLTDEKWKQNVQRAVSLNIPHLSCYALTVEPKTPLDKLIRQQKKDNINPDKQSDQFLLLMQWLEEAGYEHYEISNFAKPGYRSRHNTSYWQGRKYLGLGPSAHSFDGVSRQWNVSNNQQYIQALQQGRVPFEKEILTATQQLNEYIMTALRTAEGVQLSVLQTKFEVRPEDFRAKAEKFIQAGFMQDNPESLFLTKEGKLLADGIAADLFY